MPISRTEREEITPDESLATCAKYGLDVRRQGSRWWIYSDATKRKRSGVPSFPGDLVTLVEKDRFRGEPTLKFVRNKFDHRFVALAYTEAGVARFKSNRHWNWRIRGSLEPGRRPGRRRPRRSRW